MILIQNVNIKKSVKMVEAGEDERGSHWNSENVSTYMPCLEELLTK